MLVLRPYGLVLNLHTRPEHHDLGRRKFKHNCRPEQLLAETMYREGTRWALDREKEIGLHKRWNEVRVAVAKLWRNYECITRLS